MKNLNEMTHKEFEDLPSRQNWQEEVMCDSLIILPKKKLHDSGYRCMAFVAVSRERMLLLDDWSYVIHIDGIGGFGDNWLEKFGRCPTAIHPVGWQIDCLKTSGLLRFFANGYKIKCGPSLSSFELWAIPRETEIKRREKFEGSII